MNLQSIKDSITSMNIVGVPLPVMRDPKTGKGSITATLVVMSSFLVMVSLFSKVIVKSGAFNFYVVSLSGYLGRKMMSDGSKMEISGDDTKAQ